ncbi:hypothetical protein K7432_010699 [Basidiobolus ranarum]|uniref:Peptidase M14 domain-containing protein n=1 Tax=Basidiobolus ranarum TaxID=34480 RepID=A0ABR2WNF7_9FUNG
MRYIPLISIFLLPTVVLGVPLDASPMAIRYDNHKLVNFKRSPEILKFVEERGYDVWKNSQEGLHVRVAPEELELLKRFNYEVLIEDVQSEIDHEASEQRRVQLSKRAADWHASYHTYAEIVEWLKTLASSNPSLVNLVPSIGKSIEGRDIPAIRITSNTGGQKKQFWFQGLQHAREWISGASMQYLADTLVTGYASDSSIKSLLDTYEFIIIPVSNPDGYNYSWTKDRLWRKNRRLVNSNVYGVDLNRNWPDHWNQGGASSNPRDETYLGTSPGSEPEVANLMKYYLQQTRIAGAIDFHSYGELIMWPYGWTQKQSPWNAEFTSLGKGMKSAVDQVNPNNRYVPQMDAALYIASGGADDWFFGDQVSKKQGFITTGLTVELSPTSSSPGFVLPPAKIIPVGKDVVAMVKYFAQYVDKNPLIPK